MLCFYARVDISHFDVSVLCFIIFMQKESTTAQLLGSESGTVSIHFQLVASYYSLFNGHLNIKYNRDA